ncbi:CHAP domain-containing protein [Bombilactobacillus folatiphilus]|uniref:CHAP domain-containing protein n=1 Tax=Bombilactobacillus folatiphilus TaxID=2923362 RepID=A0ABY4P854_9LACO|nr:NlpC/P60 family protein [Bombilactobacillus folatiphilus]UQS81890.1 CHAP domain-containing protein [Bombilactobacillus folatiphilus]
MMNKMNGVLTVGTLAVAGVTLMASRPTMAKADTQATKIATTTQQSHAINLYNSKGEFLAKRILPVNTQWLVGQVAYFDGGSQNFQHALMYQVARNEWLPAADSNLNVTPVDVPTINLDSGQTTAAPTAPVNTAASSQQTAPVVNNGDAVSTARSMLGDFNYGATHGVGNIGSVANPNPNGVTDCSGFVWLALAKAGDRVPANMGWYTKSMEDDAKGAHQWLQAIDPSQAQAGDVVIVNTNYGSGQNGHTAILEGPWQNVAPASNMTPVIQMGGRTTAQGVNEDGFATSFLSLLQGNYTLTFARPIHQ